MSQSCPSWPLGLFIVSMAALVVWRGLELWQHSDLLKPDSWGYKKYVLWLSRYRPDVWKKRSEPYRTHRLYENWKRVRQSKAWKRLPRVVSLTQEDILALGIDYMLVGVLLLTVGIAVFVGWLPKGRTKGAYGWLEATWSA